MNRVLFLGAGFSAPFGHPVMNEFLPFADATSWLTEDDKEFLGRLLLEARRANSFLESSPTNLEDILSYAVMADRLGLRGDTPVAPRVCGILRKVYGRIADVRRHWSQCDKLQRFLRIERGAPCTSLSVITTNYDLNIDCALYRIGVQVAPGFDHEPVDARGKAVVARLYATNGVPLFKLHGSVNWFESTTGAGLAVDDLVGTLSDFSGRQPQQLHMPLACSGDYTPPAPPVIIPPSFLKPDLSPVLSQVWAGAAQALQAAHEVVFVGYSFPPSDTEMTYFLAHAMATNAHLRRIVVVDPLAERILDRLRATSSRFGSHFKELLIPLQGDWTELQLNENGVGYRR